MYEALLGHSKSSDDSDMFGISFEPYIWYYFDHENKCDQIFIYDTNLHSNILFSGFYYGENVDASLRREIDASISRLLYGNINSSLGVHDINSILGVNEPTRRTCGKTYRTAYRSIMFYLTCPVLVIFIFGFLKHWIRQMHRHPL